MLTLFKKSPFFRGRGLVVSFFLCLCFFGSVVLDQVSKEHMHRTLLDWEDPADTDHYAGRRQEVATFGTKSAYRNTADQYISFGWQYSRNKGAAFSMFSTIDDRYRVPMFYSITAIAVLLIFWYLRTTPLNHYFTRIGLVFVLSGAVGNFLCRLQRGYVVDFIDVDWCILGWQHDFAIFNVADVAINVGVICLLLDMFIQSRTAVKKKAL